MYVDRNLDLPGGMYREPQPSMLYCDSLTQWTKRLIQVQRLPDDFCCLTVSHIGAFVPSTRLAVSVQCFVRPVGQAGRVCDRIDTAASLCRSDHDSTVCHASRVNSAQYVLLVTGVWQARHSPSMLLSCLV